METEAIATIRNFIQELKRAKFLVLFLFAMPLAGGMFLFILKAKTYQSTAKVMVLEEDGSSSLGRMGSLASLAGINIGSSTSGIPPESYQFILESPAFLLNVLYEKIPVGGQEMTVFEYIHSQKGVLDFIRDKKELDSTDFRKPEDVPSASVPHSNAMPMISVKEHELTAIERLQKGITFNYSPSKPIEISVTTQDPEVSARILKLIIVKLETCVKQFTKDNADEDLAFVKAEAEKAKQEVYWLQTSFARAKDQSINVRKVTAQVELDRLEMDYMDARQRYAALTSQMEAVRLKSEKEKQGFVVLEPPSIADPEKPAAPKFPIYFAVSIVLGMVLSISVVFLIGFLRDLKQGLLAYEETK